MTPNDICMSKKLALQLAESLPNKLLPDSLILHIVDLDVIALTLCQYEVITLHRQILL